MKRYSILAFALAFGLAAAAPARAADSARDMYNRALAQEQTVRGTTGVSQDAAFHLLMVP